jgi:hypothetical protein
MPSLENNKTLLLLSHLAGWVLFIFITVPSFNRAGEMPVDAPFTGFMATSVLFLVLYFYLNSAVLVPRFLSRKRMLVFLGITATIFLLFCLVMPQIHRDYLLQRQPFPPVSLASPRFPSSPGNFPRHSPGILDILGRHGLYSRSSQFLVVFIASTGLKAIPRWYAEKRRLQELESVMVRAELSFLKSQVHPHFLFNSLNSIYYLALSKDDDAPGAILSLSGFLRFLTTESNHDRVPVEKEVKMMEEYAHLQCLRAPGKLDLQFHVTGDLAGWTIMPLTFIPFVENAFKHGTSARGRCFIHVRVEVSEGLLSFSCENSTGPATSAGNFPGGIGLENTRKRLALAYPGRHSLAIHPGETVYRVNLQVNLA